ncbi:MAG TPA: hypothetical protein VNB22_18940 [Pyrinomonadaceae bacterium]|nr:hypothetical protein [Pyrinomonadaceae bacterium]
MQNNQIIDNSKRNDRVQNIRLEETGWALFLIMIGGLWLLPEGQLPSHIWLVGAGLIMLGINFARYFSGIKMSGFTVFLGVVALVAGAGGIFNLALPIFPALFIILGASLLMRALFKKQD